MMGEPSTYHAKLPCLLVELPVGEEKNSWSRCHPPATRPSTFAHPLKRLGRMLFAVPFVVW